MWSKDFGPTPGARPGTRRRRHERAPGQRYEPTAAYRLAERLKRKGVEFSALAGPWRAATRPAPQAGHHAVGPVPVVTNGQTEMVVDTPERAADLSGFLNWCGVEDLNPVPELTPQEADPSRRH
jgi:hypothetical protein